jgi:hypothetical protein
VEVKEVSTRELAALAGRKTVRKYLAALKRHGLAMFTGGLWRPVIVSRENLDRLARELGNAGRGARQKEKHRRERGARDRHSRRSSPLPPSSRATPTSLARTACTTWWPPPSARG